MDEDGYRWKEHLLDGSTADGRARRWLSVEDGEGGLELALWDRVPGSDLTPDGKEVAHDGVAYRRDERGRARYASTGTTGAAESGTMEYADYLPAGGGAAAAVLRAVLRRRVVGGQHRPAAVALESIDILHS